MKPSTLLSFIAIVIAVLALIEGFFINSKIQKSDKAVTAFTQVLNTTVENQKQQLTDLSSQLKQLENSLEKNSATISENEAAVQILKQAKDLNNNRWVLIDTRHLLNMAEYNLTLVPAPNTALAILKKAEKQLASLNDPNTLPLRQAITDAVTHLKALPKIDYAGMLMQLNAISRQLTQLPLINDNATGEVQKLDYTTRTDSGWRKYWHKSLDTLEKLVIIRHQNQPIEPLISPGQQTFLVENIRLKLSQASWALLQNNQQIFENSLNTAISWINKYYAPNSVATTSVITSLKILNTINLKPELPDISHAIELTSNLLRSEQETNAAGAKL